jgi:ferredoxin
LWEASTAIGGKSYSAVNRHGAPMVLARVLIAAGIPDQPVIVCSEVCVFDNGAEIRTEQVRGSVTYRSLCGMAKWTFTKGPATPLRRVRFQEQPEGVFCVEGYGQEMRLKPPAGILASEDPAPPEIDAPKCVSCGRDFQPARRWAIFCSPACRLRAHRRARRDESPGIAAISEPVP